MFSYKGSTTGRNFKSTGSMKLREFLREQSQTEQAAADGLHIILPENPLTQKFHISMRDNFFVLPADTTNRNTNTRIYKKIDNHFPGRLIETNKNNRPDFFFERHKKPVKQPVKSLCNEDKPIQRIKILFEGFRTNKPVVIRQAIFKNMRLITVKSTIGGKMHQKGSIPTKHPGIVSRCKKEPKKSLSAGIRAAWQPHSDNPQLIWYFVFAFGCSDLNSIEYLGIK